MNIGVDISPLQGPHQMRGIGAVVTNVMNNIPDDQKKAHHFTLYLQEGIHQDKNLKDPLKLLNLDELSYDIKRFSVTRHSSRSPQSHPARRYPRLFRIARIGKNFLRLARYHVGDQRVSHGDNLDVFLQFDQEHSLPRGRSFRKALVVYDIIPYVLENDYLYSFSTARRKGHSRKGSLVLAYHRWLYLYKLRINTRRADVLLAISHQTEQDFIKIVGTPPKKIHVTALGVSTPSTALRNATDSLACNQYVDTSWGYMKRAYELSADTPFLLFVGGVDRRRKLADLVTALNHLRAEGNELKLVLAGDILEGPRNIPIPETRQSLERSSYKDDIVFMGFIPEAIREELYRRALAFVYPSVYEGFGLPVLEAMSYGCPVICYENGAVKEVAGKFPFYAQDSRGITEQVRHLLNNRPSGQQRSRSIAFAEQHTWSKTARLVLEQLER